MTFVTLLKINSRWLYRDGLLPDGTSFVGYARSKITVEDLKKRTYDYMKVTSTPAKKIM